MGDGHWTAARAVAGVVVVAAGVLAVTGASGQTCIPPSPWITWLGIGLVAACVPAVALERRWALPLAIGLLALVACQIHLRTGFPRMHDARLHLWSLWSIHRCILDGDLYPRWNPYLGLGSPLLQFYPPAVYMAAQPLMFVGLTPVQTVSVLVLSASALSGWSASWAAGRLGASPTARLAAAAALMLAPYHLHDANYRLALTELFGIALVPLFLVLGREVIRGIGGPGARWRFLVVAALLLVTHLLSALMAGIALGIWSLVEGLLRGPRRWPGTGLGLARLAALCLVSAALTGAFLIPCLGEKGHTSIDLVNPNDDRPLSANGVALGDLIERRAWTNFAGSRPRNPKPGEDPQRILPYYFGLALLAATLVALLFGVGPRRVGTGPSWRAIAGLAAMVLACLLFSAGIPEQLLDGVRLLRALQFPWRFLGPASVGAALALAIALDRAATGRWWRAGLAVFALAALAADAYPYLGAADWRDPYEGAVHLVKVGPGRTAADRTEPVDAQLPEGRFIRIERMRFPPTHFRVRVAKAHYVHKEYMTPVIHRRYQSAGGQKRNGQISARHGVERRYEDHRRGPIRLPVRALASFRAENTEDFVDLATPPVIEPERITVSLPADQPGGRVRVLFQAFPGWIYRVDGGRWKRARASHGLLAARVPAGARKVQFRYSLYTPARQWGIAVSVVAGAGILTVPWLVRRRRKAAGSPP